MARISIALPDDRPRARPPGASSPSARVSPRISTSLGVAAQPRSK
jgi:hypothetical protein